MLTDSILDAARTRGDDLADATVRAIFQSGDFAAVAGVLSTLMRDDQHAPSLPPPVQEYLAATSAVADRSAASAAAGERLFADVGPEIMMLLCCYSLPSSYAARKGVQVLHSTAYLAKRPNRRLFETAQMIVNVMTPGGLGPSGKGASTAQKVRLMHAAIRHLILNNSKSPWPTADLGVPINQEDLLGTLMTFTTLILDGLATINIYVSPEDQQAYLETWLAIGKLMGIDPELLPATVVDARAVTALIERRQVAPSPEGAEMMGALVGMMETNVPEEFVNLPSCMIREFLPPEVATFLGVPLHSLDDEMLRLGGDMLEPLEAIADAETKKHVLVRRFSLELLRWMIRVEMDGQPARFVLPDSLSQAWMVAPPDSEESFWKKLVQHIEARL